MVSEISFLSQVRILFSQSSLKMNSDLVFTHFWSGFSFFFIHSKSWSLFRSVIFDAISHNGFRLCEGGPNEAETLLKLQIFLRKRVILLKTFRPLLQNRCCAQYFRFEDLIQPVEFSQRSENQARHLFSRTKAQRYSEIYSESLNLFT